MAIEKQGVFTMSTTPFKKNGDIDYPAFGRHLKYQAARDEIAGVVLASGLAEAGGITKKPAGRSSKG